MGLANQNLIVDSVDQAFRQFVDKTVILMLVIATQIVKT